MSVFIAAGPHSVSETDVLWRYMDFGKLCALLLQKKLVLTRLTEFDDPLEGRRANDLVALWQRYARSGQLAPLLGLWEGSLESDSFAETRFKAAARILMETEEADDPLVEYLRALYFVNCWFLGGGESVSMWRLYGDIAVQTTVGHLRQAMRMGRATAVIGRVRYDIPDDSGAGPHSLALFKHPAYAAESEARIVSIETATTTTSRNVSIDVRLQELVQRLVISPFAPPYVQPALEALLHRLRLPIVIERSELPTLR